MAIEIKQQKKNNIFIYVVIILLLIMIGWVGWSFFKPSDIFSEPDIEDLLPTSSQELIEAKLDIEMVSNNPVFQTLNSHISWPLNVPDLGRVNPFKSF